MEIEARSNVLQLKQRARLRRRLTSEDLCPDMHMVAFIVFVLASCAQEGMSTLV